MQTKDNTYTNPTTKFAQGKLADVVERLNKRDGEYAIALRAEQEMQEQQTLRTLTGLLEEVLGRVDVLEGQIGELQRENAKLSRMAFPTSGTLNTKEAVQYLKISHSSFSQYVCAGCIKKTKNGNKNEFTLDALDEFRNMPQKDAEHEIESIFETSINIHVLQRAFCRVDKRRGRAKWLSFFVPCF